MSFGDPPWLLGLLVVPALVGWQLLMRRRRVRTTVRFTNLEVLAGVVEARWSWRRYVAPALLVLALAAASVATARPRVATSVATERATVILVIDVSSSMQASDVKPTRLLAAEAAVRSFLDRAPKKLRVGLIAFAGEPQVAVPPTTNHELVRESLTSLASFGGYGGTAIGDALAAATRLGRQSLGQTGLARRQPVALAQRGKRSLVSILFLSDGAQTRGQLLPLEGAAAAKKAGFPVYTVALGTPNGTLTSDSSGSSFSFAVPPDPATLHAIARATGGEFFAARTERTVTSAYSRLGSSLGRMPGRSEVTYAFLAGAAGLLLAAGVATAVWAPRIP